MTWVYKSVKAALLLSLPAAAAESAQYHKSDHFDASGVLQAYSPSLAPAPDEKPQKDQCVGNLEEHVDLSRQVSGIDGSLYQCEVAYHLQNESNGPDGKPTLPWDVSAYCSPAELRQVAGCYAALAEFNAQAARGAPDLPALAETARALCAAVPAKRVYQEYDALLNGMRQGSSK